MDTHLANFTDVLSDPDEIDDSQPLSLSLEDNELLKNTATCQELNTVVHEKPVPKAPRPAKGTGQYGQFRSIEEIDEKYRSVFTYPFFNLVQSSVIDDALYTGKSIVVSAPTGSGKTVVFEMAIVQLLMEMDDNNYSGDFKIIYMAPVKALCTERLTEWYPKFTKLGLHCIEVTGDTDVDFSQLTPYRIIITTPEKWDMLTRRWRDYRQLVEQIKLFLIDEVHILNDPVRGPVLEAVVSRMKTIESSAQSAHRIEQLQKQYRGEGTSKETPPKIRFVAVSATVGNPEDVATWLGNSDTHAVYYTFGDESRPVKLKRIVEGYPCSEGTSIFKFDIILNYKLWPVIQKYHNGKPTLIFCNTRKSVLLTAETLSREITVSFNPEQQTKLNALASTFKNKKLQSLILSGVGCHHAGLLFEERTNIEYAFRNRDLPILITTTTLAMGVNLPAHLVIIKNTQQYVNGAYQEYSISTVLQMVGRAGRPQYDTEATAVIMTRLCDKGRYQALVGGSEPLQSYLHKRLAENLNSEAALGTVGDVAQCVQWLRSTFLFVRAARDPKRYLGLPQAAPQNQISKKIEELCVKAMNGLATTGLITMDEASCIESTEAGRLMSIYYLDLETMKHIMKINGSENLEQLLWIVCESHELADMHLRVDERRSLNALNRNNTAATIRYPMKGKISTRQMKVNCMIQAILGCLPISDPSLNQEAMKIIRIADRVCRCLFAYVTQPALISSKQKYYSAVLNAAVLLKCVVAHLWANSQFVSKQLKGIGPTFSTLLASAGKVNFMLLEESHPRDLERIMNKGPPAGNILRKQISLLPKYQLTMTPVDEKSVTIQLDLLNCSYLLENIDNLTAGNTHKSNIIVGDSENHLLYFNSFNDKNLISVYSGTISFQITRIHSFEHKIFANCISSTFVGIDAHCDYIFQDLEPQPKLAAGERKRPIQKQTVITDTFKERKRKNNTDIDITQSKEKKKRESNLIEKIKNLKESFGRTSNKLKDDLEKTAIMTNKIFEDFHQVNEPMVDVYVNPIEIANIQNTSNTIDDILEPQQVFEDSNDEFMDDDKINNILNEIECEISEKQSNIKLTNKRKAQNTIPSNQLNHSDSTRVNKKCTKNKIPAKSNYNFIDLLEKNIDLNDSDEEKEQESNSNGFSDNIKGFVDKFLNQIQNVDKKSDKQLTGLLGDKSDSTFSSVKENASKSVHSPKGIRKTEINNIEVNKLNVTEDSSHKNEIITDNITLLPLSESTENVEMTPKQGIQNNVQLVNSKTFIGNEEPNLDNNFKNLAYNLINLPEIEFNINKGKDLQPKPLETETKDTFTQSSIINNENIGDKEDFYKQNKLKLLTDISNMNSNCCFNINSEKNDNHIKQIENQDAVEISQRNNNLHQCFHNENRFIIKDPSPVNEISDRELYEVFPPISFNFKTDSISSSNEKLNQRITTQDNIKEDRNSTNNFDNLNRILHNPVNDNRYASQNNDHKTEYIKKYSYTAGHTNVITKVTDDSIVRITRKLQLNLDVTEVLHRNTICTVKKQSNKLHKNKVQSDLRENYSDFKIPDIKDTSKNFEHPNNTSSKETDFELSLSQSPTQLSEAKLNYIEQKSPGRSMKSKPNINQNEKYTNVNKDVRSNEIVQAIATDFDKDNERNNINNILKKYGEIMRNKNTIEVHHTGNQNVKPRSNNIEAAKPKRPFKISDIDKLNTNIPSFLIQQSNPNTNDCSVNSEVKALSPKVKEIFDYPITSKCNVVPLPLKDKDTTIQDLDQNVDNYTTDVFPQNDELDDVNSNEMKIDPNMLNPKTLLQCFSNEEPPDVLPPPPEFCDNSPNYQYEDDMSDSYDPVKWQTNFDDDTQTSIFENNLDIELTPTKEIETWTLSQDSEIDNSSLGLQSSAQQYLVMKQNTQNDLQYRTTMTRHAQLGQFKFSKKKKLKL